MRWSRLTPAQRSEAMRAVAKHPRPNRKRKQKDMAKVSVDG
jgi:hypothetical protein